MAPFLPFFVLEAAAASLAPLFSLEDSLDGGRGGFGFFFFGLSLTSGLEPNAFASFSNSLSCSSSSRSFCSAASAAAFALLAVRHTLTAVAKGHNRAAFDSGVMAEEGFGTPPHIVNAYVAYILGCMARDERAIAKVRELRADMSAPFFVALGTAHDRGILTEARVRGNETLEDLREFYLMFEPPGNHP